MSQCLEDALLSGLPIGAGQTANCSWCNAALLSNDAVELHAYLIDECVDIGGLRCEDCAREEIRFPTLGATEWVARGKAAPSITAGGHSQLVLEGPEIVDTSPPTEGSEP